MTRDEHKKIVQSLLGMIDPNHQADASEMLTTLSDDYDSTLSASESATSEVAVLRERNERLRAVNTDLFLKVGNTAKETHKEETSETDNTPKLNYNDLFNEKGELK